jgi:tetratricopeptide (TPR) repeat protein
MSDLSGRIQKLLDTQLQQNGMDLVDFVPIPMHGDRMVRLRTLKEVLEDFEETGNPNTAGYFVQVRQRPETDSTPHHADPNPISAAAAEESAAYLPEGKLNVPYLMRNASLLVVAGELTLAKNIYKAVLQTGERTPEALFGIGQCLESEGKLPEARKNYEESIAYLPTLESYRRLGLLLMRMDKNQEAAEVLTRALNIKEMPTEMRVDLEKACGNSWLKIGRFEDAERHFRRALELIPHQQSHEIRGNLGALYLRQGRTSEAKRTFQEILSTNQRSAKAYIGLASCYLADGEKRLAHDCFAQALQIDLNNPTALFHLVKCAYEIKSYATAARIVEEYMQVAPVNTSLMYSLAGLQFHLGRRSESAVTARRILALQPGHPGASELLRTIERRFD